MWIDVICGKASCFPSPKPIPLHLCKKQRLEGDGIVCKYVLGFPDSEGNWIRKCLDPLEMLSEQIQTSRQVTPPQCLTWGKLVGKVHCGRRCNYRLYISYVEDQVCLQLLFISLGSSMFCNCSPQCLWDRNTDLKQSMFAFDKFFVCWYLGARLHWERLDYLIS